ncbi:hypothetical protein CAPTEDRAFT_221820 [Capitella teleta]|uniref:Transmembrane protein 237 n=1 Tax=Capitella teleta TaxID=283909 RepID=R7V2N2_CAPTE|nr:hypothetical protein CAPTEDRAFT_221820 [Capitella teleta]|eukprot:ELU09966.1 hypothetical protein CAPTEDRAFT_221820 [Capitella teleta]
MTDEIPLPKRGTLPPLTSTQNGESRRNVHKKRNPRQGAEEVGSDATPRSRSRSNSRPRQKTGSDKGQTSLPKESVTPRNKRPQPKRDSDYTSEGDGIDIPDSQRKPKKPRNSQPRSQSKEVLISESDTVSPKSAPAKKKKKKKKQVSSMDEPEVIGLEAELSGIDDDVVVTDETQSSMEAKWTVPTMRSEPINKVFIEQKSGFKSADKAKIAKKRAEEMIRATQIPMETTSMTTIKFALSTHKVFKVISVFLNGLFAGITLWQIIAVYMLLNEGDIHFLENYHMLAQPVQSIFYFLFAVCTVAAFDRYDIGRIDRRFLLRAVTLQSGAIVALFYVIGLIFSLAMAPDDNRIALYPDDHSLWEDPEDAASRLRTWKILNTVRGVFAVLAWLIISLRPVTDRLTKNLEKADENIIEPQYADPEPEIEIIR